MGKDSTVRPRRTRQKANTVPHPGQECCDPNTDLVAWLADAHRKLQDMRDSANEFAKLGEQLKAKSIQATIADDHTKARDLQTLADAAYSKAACLRQDLCIRTGRVDGVEKAHAYRLPTPARPVTP